MKDAENTNNWRTTLIIVSAILAVAVGLAFLLWVQQEYGDSAVLGVLSFAAGLLVGQVVRVFDIIHTRNTLQNAARMAETKASSGSGGGSSAVLDPTTALLLSFVRQQQPTTAQTDMMTRVFMSGIENGRKQIANSPWDSYDLSLGDPAAAPDPADIWSAPPASSNGHRP